MQCPYIVEVYIIVYNIIIESKFHTDYILIKLSWRASSGTKQVKRLFTKMQLMPSRMQKKSAETFAQFASHQCEDS